MTPILLAWLQLTYRKTRLLVFLAGIVFAVFLMLMQLGLLDSLYESATAVHRNLKGDLVLIHQRSLALYYLEEFPRQRLYQAMNFNDIESFSYLYVTFGKWNSKDVPYVRNIYVFGVNPKRIAFRPEDINAKMEKLYEDDAFLFDKYSRPFFGNVLESLVQNSVTEAELNNQRIKIVGLFGLGPSLESDGSLITSESSFLKVFYPLFNQDNIHIGLLNIKSDSNIRLVQEMLQKRLPNDVKVLTHQEFIDFEKHFWTTNRAVGFIFWQGAVMGFIIGTVFIYQILYVDISEHLHEYAILKARGYRARYFWGVVFQESLFLSSLGYFPGVLLSLAIYSLTRSITVVPIYMTLSRALLVFCLTVAMSFIAGIVAIRKLREVDPIDLLS
jgi:putative ABC transport system permease protein